MRLKRREISPVRDANDATYEEYEIFSPETHQYKVFENERTYLHV